MLVDFPFDHRVTQDIDSISVLTELANIGSIGFCPFICTADARLLDLSGWQELTPTIAEKTDFTQPCYRRWLRLCEQQASQFLSCVAIRTRVRPAYQDSVMASRNRFFHENISTHDDILWGSSIYHYANAIVYAFQQSGWFLSINQSPNHWCAETQCYSADDNHQQQRKNTTECYLSDRLEQGLNRLGLITARDHRISGERVFHYHATLYQPRAYSKAIINQTLSLNSQLNYVLCAARFAQIMKVMLRDKVGHFQDANACEHWLQKWVLRYCSNNSESDLTRYPLKASQVRITASSNRPGAYFCVFHIQPHTLIDNIDASIKLGNPLLQLPIGQRHGITL